MKRIISIILTICMLMGLTGYIMAEDTKTEISFTDVDKNSLTAEAIYKMANAGIIVGDGDGTFRPKDGITRAELARIINLISAYTEADEEAFADVKESDWFYKDVQIAKKQGYIVGFEDGTFRGNENVTRQQVCVILCKVAGLYDLGIPVEIADEVSEWARPYVEMAVVSSLITLEDGNKFRAKEDMTREEFCVPFSAFVTINETEESPSPSPSTKPSGGGGGGASSGGGGGSGGGSGGGTISTPPPTPTLSPEEIQEENAQMLSNLTACHDDLELKLGYFSAEYSIYEMMCIIKDCIGYVISDAATNIIDTAYIVAHYSDSLIDAKEIYDSIMENPLAQAKFQQDLAAAKLNEETITWLGDQFGIDMGEYL